MICDLCGKKGVRVRRTTQSFGRGRSTFLIEGIPMLSCPACRGSYLTAATLEEIDRIRRGWRKLTVKKRMSVAQFAKNGLKVT